MRVLVCGGRNYCDAMHVFTVLDRIEAERGPIDTVIHGMAKGADLCADAWARTRAPNVTGILGYQADWKHDGKAAGPIRNQRMLDDGKPDLVVAFPGGKGTADMVGWAKRAGIEVVEIARPSEGVPKDTQASVLDPGPMGEHFARRARGDDW